MSHFLFNLKIILINVLLFILNIPTLIFNKIPNCWKFIIYIKLSIIIVFQVICCIIYYVIIWILYIVNKLFKLK